MKGRKLSKLNPEVAMKHNCKRLSLLLLFYAALNMAPLKARSLYLTEFLT